MKTFTNQDLQAITQVARDEIIDRLVTKYDVQAACDNIKDQILATVQALHMENQAFARQSNAQKDQTWRKLTEIEDQLTALQAEIRELNQKLTR